MLNRSNWNLGFSSRQLLQFKMWFLTAQLFDLQSLTEVKSRTQGSRPRTQKKSEAKAKDSHFEDRHSRGQGQECSKPRPRTKDTSASALQKKKALHKILTIQKIVLSSSRGQANFRGLEASRPRPRTWPSRPRPRTSKCVLEDSTSGYWYVLSLLLSNAMLNNLHGLRSHHANKCICTRHLTVD